MTPAQWSPVRARVQYCYRGGSAVGACQEPPAGCGTLTARQRSRLLGSWMFQVCGTHLKVELLPLLDGLLQALDGLRVAEAPEGRVGDLL